MLSSNPVPLPQPADAIGRVALRAYRRRQHWLALALLVQLVGGLGVLLAPGREIFPLYSWFLFPLTPNPGVRFDLRLLEYRGVNYDPPAPLETARVAIAPTQAPAVVALGRNLGRAVAVGDAAEIRRLRGILEGNFLPEAGRYVLVEMDYDPVARLRTGAEQNPRTVRVFKIGEP